MIEVSHNEEGHMDTAFLDTMTSNQESSWRTSITPDGKDVLFKIDTGAEVTAISHRTYLQMSTGELSDPEKILYGPSRQPLPVIGQFSGNLVHKGKVSTQTVYVIEGLKINLLGLPAITALQLLVRVDATSMETSVFERYPSVFSGLGNLGDEYEIQLKPDAKPYALHTPRSVPLPLRDKVRKELERMESLGVISKVDEPTEWCAGMVVVPKKNGTL